MPSDVCKHGSERGGNGLKGKCYMHVQLQKQMKGNQPDTGSGRNEG